MNVNKNSETKYISLQEATKYCDYSQEYLSLRARQGKLKAVKIGRNWVTTKEWIRGYVREVNGQPAKEEIEITVKKEKIIPPENLPVETPAEQLSLIGRVIPRVRWGFVAAFLFVLLISGFFIFWQIQPRVSFEDEAAIVVNLDSKEVRASTVETLKAYGEWLKSQVPEIKNKYLAADDFLMEKFSQGYRMITRLFNKVYHLAFSPPEEKEVPEIEEEPEIPEAVEEGMVVIPSTEEDEEIVAKIKDSFSDEVRVEQRDDTSGIVIPVFREKEGEEYLYIMVPLKN